MTPRIVAMVTLCCLPAISIAQFNSPPTPVPILKQINRHNEDGSYTYGYEGADGSFKIESKTPSGEVRGKYGFLDDSGRLREIEYGASSRGFEPFGEGITVAPPTLHRDGLHDDGQYYPEKYEHPYGVVTSSRSRPYSPPAKFYSYSSGGSEQRYQAPRFPQPQHRFQDTRNYQQQPQQYQQPEQQYQYQPQPQPQPQHQYQPQQRYHDGRNFQQPQQNRYQEQPYRQTYQQPQYRRRYEEPEYIRREPIVLDPSVFEGHPANGIDLNSGSYSVTGLSFTG